MSHIGSRRIADGIQDGRCGGDQYMLAQTFRTVWSMRVGHFDNDRFDLRHIANSRDQVVVQVLGVTGSVVFHQCHTDTLRHATFNLAFHDWHEPAERMLKAAAAAQVKVATPVVGERFEPTAEVPEGTWWRRALKPRDS